MGDDMDKVKEVDNGFNHGITLVERKNIVISGVKKIESFDNDIFTLIKHFSINFCYIIISVFNSYC